VRSAPAPLGRIVFGMLLVALALGVFFRIYHADWKLYNPDETNSSIRISGHTVKQVSHVILDGKLHHVSELAEFAVPTAETKPSDIWHSLASEDPQHPPLFFLATFASERITGDSIFFRRLPGLIFGLLAVWAAWWFGRELFGDAAPAWILAALVAVSPFHVAFSQEAREYSFFLLATCASSALLLAAVRTGNRLLLGGYALSVALGCWGFTLFLVVVAAQGLYAVLPVSGAPFPRRLSAIVALVVGVLTFVPWLVNLAKNAGVAVNDTAWQATSLSAPLYAGKWLFNIGSAFFDLDYISLAWLPVVLLALAIALVACVAFFRESPPRVWLLPVLIGAIPLLALLIPDVLKHETRALQSRYLTTTLLAIEIGTAGGLWIVLRNARGIGLLAGRAGLCVLLACGVLSCAVSSQARTWWVTGQQSMRAMPAIADRLRQAGDATIVYLADADDILVLEPYSTPTMSFQLHQHLDDDALRSAAHPYAILSSEQMSHEPLASRMQRVPLVMSFEMRPDPAIDELRRRGAAARKLEDNGRLDLGLYALAPSATRP